MHRGWLTAAALLLAGCGRSPAQGWDPSLASDDALVENETEGETTHTPNVEDEGGSSGGAEQAAEGRDEGDSRPGLGSTEDDGETTSTSRPATDDGETTSTSRPATDDGETTSTSQPATDDGETTSTSQPATDEDGTGSTTGAPDDPCDGFAEFEEPPGSGQCVVDPCRLVECDEDATCVPQDDRSAICECQNGWEGPHCDYRWTPIEVPPFPRDLDFDTQGNAWLLTTQGLLHWNLAEASADSAPGACALLSSDPAYLGVELDSRDRKWLVATGGQIHMLDDGGTPADASDDTWVVSSSPLDFFDRIGGFAIDSLDRVWVLGKGEPGGIRVLEDISQLGGTSPVWHTLLEGTQIIAFAPEGSGLWLSTETGVRFIDLGASLADPADDVSVDLGDVPLLQGREVSEIFVGEDRTKWFNATTGVVTLTDGGAPLDPSGHVWSVWSPSDAALSLGDGPVLQLGPDDTPWRSLPSGSVVSDTAAYSPASCAGFAEQGPQAHPDKMIEDDLARVWLSVADDWYRFDDGATPTEAADDAWIRLRRKTYESPVVVLPEPSGGLWIQATTGRRTGPRVCNALLYYVRVEQPQDAWDDAWTQAIRPEQPGCFSLAGLDARQRVWINDSGLFAYGGFTGFEPRAVLSEDEDAFVRYTAEADALEYNWITPDIESEALWCGPMRFGVGDSLSDKSDDLWARTQDVSPSAHDMDGSGHTWFTYADGYGWTYLRRLDERGTPFDTSDDAWLHFEFPDELGLTYAGQLWIDGYDWKWLRSQTTGGESILLSFNDGGTPADTSDDAWRTYEEFETAHGAIVTLAKHPSRGLWVATESGFGYLELDR